MAAGMPAAILNVVVTASTAQANAALAKTQAQLGATASAAGATAASTSRLGNAANKASLTMQRYAKTGAFALGAVAVASVKMAADFEDAMVQISTQAGASMDEVERMKGPVLDLARASEFGPVALAKGLFRVESAGYRGAEAMRILKNATDLADVGHADLEQTTRAYVAAVKSGIRGTQNFAQAAGLMNAIVGQGSMRMDDLVSAFSTGLLPRAKLVGVGLDEIGAALGVLTEQGMGAAQSATRLGMTLSFMVRKPTADAAEALGRLNIKQGEMANLLQQPNGLLKVLTLLHDRLQKIPEAQRAAMIGQLFGGGRGSAAIGVLINSLDQYEGKLGSVRKQQKDFSDKIEEDNQTMSSKVAAAWSYIQAEMTEFGGGINSVLNVVIKFVKALKRLEEQGGPIGTVIGAIGQTFKMLVNPIEYAWERIKWFAGAIIDVLNVIPGVDINKPWEGGGGLTPKSVMKQGRGSGGRGRGRAGTTARQMGGFAGLVPGSGIGDKMLLQAAVEPREGIFIMNRNAMGALQAWNDAVPRFGIGGWIAEQAKKTPAGKIISGGIDIAKAIASLPGLDAIPGWVQPAGRVALDAAKKFIKDKIGVGGGGDYGDAGNIIALGHALQEAGYSVGEHPAFGGVTPGVHVPNSWHYRGRAIDISGGDLDKLYGQLRASGLPFLELLWRVPNHYDHIHAALQKGGIVPSGNWNKNQLTTLAAFVGMKNPALMAAIAMAESGGIPSRRGSSGEYGLWQIMPSWGGGSSLLDPIKNARKAKEILGVQGLTAWTMYKNQGYKRYLGGKVKPGLLAALRGETTTAAKKGKKDKKAWPSQEEGLEATIAALQAGVEAENARREMTNARYGAINELRKAGNLEALQRYQVGMAQNSMLGLAQPGMPVQASMLSMLPMLPDYPEGLTRGPKRYRNRLKTGVKRRRKVQSGAEDYIENHIYIDGKHIDHRTKKQIRRSGRRANRPLPSRGGGI